MVAQFIALWRRFWESCEAGRKAYLRSWRGQPPEVRYMIREVVREVPVYSTRDLPPTEVRPHGRWRVVTHYKGREPVSTSFMSGAEMTRWWEVQTHEWAQGNAAPDSAEFMDGPNRRDWWPR